MYIDNVRGVDQYGLDFHIITVPSMAVSSRFIVREKSSLDPRLTSDLLRTEGLLLLRTRKEELCSARPAINECARTIIRSVRLTMCPGNESNSPPVDVCTRNNALFTLS